MNLGLPEIVIFITMLAVLVALFLVFGGGSGQQAHLRKKAKQLKKRKEDSRKKTPQEAAALSLRRKKDEPKSRLILMLMRPLPDLQVLNNKLQRAGSKKSAKQFLLYGILSTIGIALVFILLGKSLMVGLCVGFILSVWMPLKILNRKIAKQQKKFLQLFPDAIDLIVRGLRSGLPVSESITLVSQEVPDPVSSAFEHLSHTMKLGVPMEQALQEVAERLDYTEFNFFVTSIILQRETGGNLSEILNNLGEVLRKRYMMRMKIKAMTSEARASSMIIGVLPFIVTGAVSVLSPDYILPLIYDYRGNIAAGIAAGMLFLGVWTMQRMAKFEI